MCVHAFTSAAADKPRFDKVHFFLGGDLIVHLLPLQKENAKYVYKATIKTC